MYFKSNKILLGLMLCSAVLVPATSVRAIGTTELLVITGTPTPGDNGSYADFGNATINNAGQVAFNAALTGTSGGSADDLGYFVADGLGGVLEIVREGQATPSGNGTFDDFSRFIDFNNAGQLLFQNVLNGTAGGSSDNLGYYLGDGSATPQRIIREGYPIIGHTTTFSFISSSMDLNDAGQVVYTIDSSSVYRSEPAGRHTRIASTGTPTADATGVFTSPIRSASINDSGLVGFGVALTGTPGGANDNSGLFSTNGAGPPTEIAREGDAVPGSAETFNSVGLSDVSAINVSGQIAAQVSTSGVLDGVYLFDPNQDPVALHLSGELAPDGNGTVSDPQGNLLNDAGQFAYLAFMAGSANGSFDNTAIFHADPDQGTTIIAREGDAAPDGNGVFSDLQSKTFDMNNAGQFAFEAGLRSTSGGASDSEGIFFFDDTLGLVQVARRGDSFLGSTVTDVRFQEGTVNDHGQLAYAFDLADGRQGIAVWSAPVPLPADLSGDGDVDDEDLGLFFAAFTGPDLSQGPLTHPAADLSGDGDVDDEDLGLAFADFTGPLVPINVPEPASLALLVLGGMACSRRRGLL